MRPSPAGSSSSSGCGRTRSSGSRARTPRTRSRGSIPSDHAAYCGEAIRIAAGRVPVDRRAHDPHARRERRARAQLGLLEGRLRRHRADAGRAVRLDLHAKGLDQETLDLALATGLPLTVSPKFSAEHMGLPYHQAAMRELDRPPTDRDSERDGQGELHERERRDAPVHAVQLRGLPARRPPLRRRLPRSGRGRSGCSCGATPRWRRGSAATWASRGARDSNGASRSRSRAGKARRSRGPRDGYADASLSTADDWEKHAYTFRLFGRLLYDPGRAARGVAALAACDARAGRGARRGRAGEREPHPAARHERAPPVRVEQLLLARGLHGHRDRGRGPVDRDALLRHARAEAVRHRHPARSGGVPDGRGVGARARDRHRRRPLLGPRRRRDGSIGSRRMRRRRARADRRRVGASAGRRCGGSRSTSRSRPRSAGSSPGSCVPGSRTSGTGGRASPSGSPPR